MGSLRWLTRWISMKKWCSGSSSSQRWRKPPPLLFFWLHKEGRIDGESIFLSLSGIGKINKQFWIIKGLGRMGNGKKWEERRSGGKSKRSRAIWCPWSQYRRYYPIVIKGKIRYRCCNAYFCYYKVKNHYKKKVWDHRLGIKYRSYNIAMSWISLQKPTYCRDFNCNIGKITRKGQILVVCYMCLRFKKLF